MNNQYIEEKISPILPNRLQKAAPYLLALLSGCYYTYLASRLHAPYNSDFFGFCQRISAIGAAQWQQVLVDGLYPLGYPFLIKALSYIIPDYREAAVFLSIGSGLLSLILFYKIVSLFTRSNLAFFATVLLAFNPTFALYNQIEGTDAPALCLFLAAFYTFISGKFSSKSLLLAGAFFGCGYLFRYTTLVYCGAAVLVLVIYFWQSPKILIGKICFLLGSFLIFSMPQWLSSLLIMHNPVYNTQHLNVWHALFGGGKFWRLLAYGNSYKSTLEVVEAAGWPAFLKSYAINLYRIFCLNVFSIPAYFLWVPGALMALRFRSEKVSLSATIFILSFSMAVSLAFVTDRIVITLLPLEIILVFFLANLVFETSLLARKWGPRSLMLSISVLSIFSVFKNLEATPGLDPRIITTDALVAHGMKNPKEVLSFSFSYYNAESLQYELFAMPWWGSRVPIRSADEVVWMACRGNYTYILVPDNVVEEMNGFDQWYGPHSFSGKVAEVFRIDKEVVVFQLTSKQRQACHWATQKDWEKFAGNNSRLASVWNVWAAVLQEKKQAPDKLLDYQLPLVLSKWRQYKGAHSLL
jgi:hypothetical protein